MSDFLTDLVDRSLQNVPVLQRRRPSLFESAPTLDSGPNRPSPLLEEDSEVDNQLESDGLQYSTPMQHTTSRPAPGFTQTSISPSATQTADENGKDRSTFDYALGNIETIVNKHLHKALSIPRAGETRLSLSSEDSSRRAKPNGDATPKSAQRTDSKHAEPSSDRSVPTRSRGQSRPEQVPKVTPTDATTPIVVRDPGPLRPDRPPATLVRTPPVWRSDTEEAPAVKRARATPPPNRRPPIPTPRAAGTGAARATTSIPTPAPIQVTIGRVEVRANPMPTPATRRAAPAKPRLSLEDYLRSRNGGSQ